MAVLGTFASGQILTAAELNAIGTWTSYTPTWTGLTVNNGTSVGSYVELNEIVFFYARISFGSTTSLTGPVSVTYPKTALNLYQAAAGCQVYLEDANATEMMGYPYRDTTSAVEIRVATASTNYVTPTALTSTVPFSWAASDIILVSGFYQKA